MKRSLFALTLLAALPFAASAAEGVSYNYVQGGYVATNGDSNADANGFGIDGSVAVHPNFHLFGGYNQQEIDNTNVNIDQWKLGIGYNYEIAPKADLVTRIAYAKYDAGSALNVNGYSAEVGVRGALGAKVEGYAMAGYEDFKKLDSNYYGRVGAQVKFNQNWGLSGDVKFADGDIQWFVGPRLTW
jgi:Ax21 family sulfation-dependent quorum factor